MLDTTKAKENKSLKDFAKYFEANLLDGVSIHKGVSMLNHRDVFNVLAPYIEERESLAHQAGREEMRKECLAAVPERLAGHYADEHVGSVLGHNDCREQTINNIKNIK